VNTRPRRWTLRWRGRQPGCCCYGPGNSKRSFKQCRSIQLALLTGRIAPEASLVPNCWKTFGAAILGLANTGASICLSRSWRQFVKVTPTVYRCAQRSASTRCERHRADGSHSLIIRGARTVAHANLLALSKGPSSIYRDPNSRLTPNLFRPGRSA
jgi:hypothetical protein